MVETDKDITLIRHEDCMQYPMLYLGENAVLRGFTIIDTSKWPDAVPGLEYSPFPQFVIVQSTISTLPALL